VSGKQQKTPPFFHGRVCYTNWLLRITRDFITNLSSGLHWGFKDWSKLATDPGQSQEIIILKRCFPPNKLLLHVLSNKKTIEHREKVLHGPAEIDNPWNHSGYGDTRNLFDNHPVVFDHTGLRWPFQGIYKNNALGFNATIF
jgi:hypothetical protein